MRAQASGAPTRHIQQQPHAIPRWEGTVACASDRMRAAVAESPGAGAGEGASSGAPTCHYSAAATCNATLGREFLDPLLGRCLRVCVRGHMQGSRADPAAGHTPPPLHPWMRTPARGPTPRAGGSRSRGSSGARGSTGARGGTTTRVGGKIRSGGGGSRTPGALLIGRRQHPRLRPEVGLLIRPQPRTLSGRAGAMWTTAPKALSRS